MAVLRNPRRSRRFGRGGGVVATLAVRARDWVRSKRFASEAASMELQVDLVSRSRNASRREFAWTPPGGISRRELVTARCLFARRGQALTSSHRKGAGARGRHRNGRGRESLPARVRRRQKLLWPELMMQPDARLVKELASGLAERQG